MPTDFPAIRRQAGLSQSQAAALLGVPVRTLQHWELTAATGPYPDMARRLLAILTGQERVPRRPRAAPRPRETTPGAAPDR